MVSVGGSRLEEGLNRMVLPAVCREGAEQGDYGMLQRKIHICDLCCLCAMTKTRA